MTSLDDEIGAIWDRGPPVCLADLGGVAFFEGRAEALAQAGLMPEVLGLVLGEESVGFSAQTCLDFIWACVSVPVGRVGARASSYKDAIEALVAVDIPYELAEGLQDRLTRRIADVDDDEVARWVALGAAFQIALNHSRLRHLLLSTLLRLRDNPRHHPEFARRVAKIAGIAHSHWPDGDLLLLLKTLSSVSHARDEAMFEIGMAHVRDGLDAKDRREVDMCFDEALSCFNACLAAREHRPDARAYVGALQVLTGLRRGDDQAALAAKAARIEEEVVIGAAWGGASKPAWPWMGARWSELLRWQDLVGRIVDLSGTDDEDNRADVEIIARQRLLGTYIANRSVLARGSGGVDFYLQPHVEAQVLKNDGMRVALSGWLTSSSDEEATSLRGAASALLTSLAQIGVSPGKHLGTVRQLA